MAGRSASKSASKRKPSTSKRRSLGGSPVKELSFKEQPTSSEPKTPPRPRRLASEFAGRKSSVKKRARKTPKRNESQEPGTEEEEVDSILRQVRQLMDSKSTNEKTKALADALKRADQTFANDVTPSSSDGEMPSSQVEIMSNKKSVSLSEKKKPKQEKTKKTPSKPLKTPEPMGERSKETPKRKARVAKAANANIKLSAKNASARKKKVSPSDSDSDVDLDSEKHKAQIAALKKNDPEFFKYLEENDGSLLDFDLSEDIMETGTETRASALLEDESEKDEMPGDEGHGEDHVSAQESASGSSSDEEDVRMSATPSKWKFVSQPEQNDSDDEDSSAESDALNRTGFKSFVPKVTKRTPRQRRVSIASKTEKNTPKGVGVMIPPQESFPEDDDAKSNDAKTAINENASKLTNNFSKGFKQTPRQRRSSVASKPENGIAGKNKVTTTANESPSESSDVDVEEAVKEKDTSREEDVKNDVRSGENGIMGSQSSKGPENDSDNEMSDVHGYSDESDDDDAEEEARAAAEVGLASSPEEEVTDEESNDGDSEKAEKTEEKAILVNLSFLKELKERLKTNRSSLKACKDMLRIFRAGREVLPKTKDLPDKSTKLGKKGRKSRSADDEDVIDSEFDDDGTFTAGTVKFASAKSYQLAMNMAIIGIQDGIDKILGKPETKKESLDSFTSKWNPMDSARWSTTEGVFRPFVFHLLALSESTEDPRTARFLLKRLEKLVPYTLDNKVLLKKILKIAVQTWASDAKHVSETSRLCAYILLTRLAHGKGNAETVLRSCCHTFSTKIASTCNLKTMRRIEFSVSCLLELFGIDMGASYTTAFSYLREMAVALRTVLISKQQKEDIERLHNWSFVNRLRLFGKIVGKYGAEDELRPLIYPYVQVALGVMRVQPTPRTYPLRLHIASYLTELTEDTGVFIPLVPHLLTLLRCTELHRRPIRGDAKALDWRTLLRVADDVVKTRMFLNGIVDGVVLQTSRYFTTISKHVSFPEIAHFAEVTLRKASKQMFSSDWKSSLTGVAEKLQQTSTIVADARSKADFSPHGAVSSEGMLAVVPGLDRNRKMPIQKLYETERARTQKEQAIRDAKVRNGKNVDGEGETDVEEGAESEEEKEVVTKEKSGSKRKRRRSQSREDGKSAEGAKNGSKKVRFSVVDDDSEQDEVRPFSMDSDNE